MFAASVKAALAANTFVFDGADLMPPAVGQGTLLERHGRLVTRAHSTQDVADTVEASWPESR